jgi:4-methylaminobutanoate oxidase (formaldehyde-forming)
MSAVKLDKADGFIGQGALVRLRNTPPAKRLVTIVLDSSDFCLWGGEALVIDGEPVGEISSAGWSDAAGRFVALGYVRGDGAARVHAGASIVVDVWGDAVAASTWDFWSPGGNAAPAPR